MIKNVLKYGLILITLAVYIECSIEGIVEPPLVTVALTDMTLVEALSWIKSHAANGSNYTITLGKDESIEGATINANTPDEKNQGPGVLSFDKKQMNITLKGDEVNRIITINNPGTLFTVDSGVTLVLADNITLQGRSNNSAPLVLIKSGGAVVIEGGTICDNYIVNGAGGGVYVCNNGQFLLKSGIIKNNYTAFSGGGVCIASRANFIMTGGEISSNTALSVGGGVAATGSFTKTGGTIGSNITSSFDRGVARGHAVYISGARKRNTTAGPTVNLDSSISGAAGGWE